jgi:diguanylate cyclase
VDLGVPRPCANVSNPLSPLHPHLRAITSLVYGDDKHMRIRLKQWSFTLVVYSCYVALLGLSWTWGTTSGLEWATWTASVYAGLFAFYGVIRSGLSQRWQDAALTREQILFGIGTATAGYVLAGPYGTAFLFSMMLTLMFGAFSLGGRTMLRLTGVAVACVVSVIANSTDFAPGRLDIFNICTLLFVLPGITVLSARLGQMRAKLIHHKKSLEQAYARIELLAMRDELTGLLNRRFINEALQRERALVGRGHAPLCVAMLDLDHFKRINDVYGHLGGDVVLQAFARLAEHGFRDTDQVARWGGEEFLVLMPATGTQSAVAAAQRLLSTVRQARFPELSPDLRVTVSIGMAVSREGESTASLIDRADRALYEAKAGGRDRIVVSNNNPPDEAARGATPTKDASAAKLAHDLF